MLVAICYHYDGHFHITIGPWQIKRLLSWHQKMRLLTDQSRVPDLSSKISEALEPNCDSPACHQSIAETPTNPQILIDLSLKDL